MGISFNLLAENYDDESDSYSSAPFAAQQVEIPVTTLNGDSEDGKNFPTV
jgi:hypothetical protein